MNSIWNKNKNLFKKRFPALAQRYSAEITETEKHNGTEQECAVFFAFWKITHAKNGSICVIENNMPLHSLYNPEREAAGAVAAVSKECTAGVFCGFGLGYTAAVFADSYPEKTLILIEPDIYHFLAALSLFDWTPILSCLRLVIVLSCPAESVVPLIEQQSIQQCTFFSVNAQTAHSARYFETLHTLISRNKKKNEINTATLERFSKLWLRNSCANIKQIGLRSGVNKYTGHAAAAASVPALPFLVLAAGPSLADILPQLSALKEHAVIVCVDTALRACLGSGTEPDFIVLTDPQYYAYRHIAGLSSPSSVLITESSVYPATFRFPCRSIVLCSALFPLGCYFEKTLGKKGDLGAGGSVASCAWNFAYLAGAAEIFTAGLDLAFPGKQTHIRGSTFEQDIHTSSDRNHPAETAGTASLYSIQTEKSYDYNGMPVLTDVRMKMFAWWFESRLASCPAVKTYTFGSQGLCIPGILPVSISTLLDRPVIIQQKEAFFTRSELQTNTSLTLQKEAFDKAYRTLIDGFRNLYDTAYSGLSLCNKVLSKLDERQCTASFPKLAEIDRSIMGSSIKNIVSLVFPTGHQLSALYAHDQILSSPDTPPACASVRRSSIIYSELCKAVKEYRTALDKQTPVYYL